MPPTTTTAIPSTTSTTEAPLDAERLARTVLMVGMPLTYVDEATTAHLTQGGRAVLLLGHNIVDADQLQTLTSDVACAADAPVLVAVDQELGIVNRLWGLTTPLPSPAAALDMDPEAIREAAVVLGEEMIGLGINLDLAPVLDVVRGPNPALQGRHLGSDPELVAAVGVAFASGLASSGVGSVAKHFPGHGLSATDTHEGASVIDVDLTELAEIDWVPFEAAIGAGIPAVMVTHAIYTSIDGELPASLSSVVYDLLRARFGFDGVALTDAINMRALTGTRTQASAAVAALAAGADLIISPDWSQTGPIVAQIADALESGELRPERLVEAAQRVEALAARLARIDCTIGSS